MLIKNTAKNICAAVVFRRLVINSQEVVLGVKSALSACYNNVIPSLFIFIVFATYISQENYLFLLSLPLRFYANLMKCNDKKYSAYLLISLIGGFAVGARFLDRMKKGGCEENFLKVCSVSMINNSFAFCVFGVGIGMLKNVYLGLMMFLSLTFSSLICRFLLSFVLKYRDIDYINTSRGNISFTDSVSRAVSATLNICGYVIIFLTICNVLSLYIQNQAAISLFSALFEVTTSCLTLCSQGNPNIYAVCRRLSIMPLSTLCQVYSFTGDKEIIKTLIYSRIIHTPVSLCILSVITHIFPVASLTSVTGRASVKIFRAGADISCVMFLAGLLFIALFDKNKLFTKPAF